MPELTTYYDCYPEELPEGAVVYSDGRVLAGIRASSLVIGEIVSLNCDFRAESPSIPAILHPHRSLSIDR